jgi:hypothetical protein
VGFLDHLSLLRSPGPYHASLAALQVAAEFGPQAVLERSDELDEALRGWSKDMALEALAAANPRIALAHIAGLPNGDERDELIASVAKGYARFDLADALVWYSSLQEHEKTFAYAGITSAMAAVDLSSAVEFHLLETGGRGMPPAWLMLGGLSDLDNPGQVADSIADADAGFMLGTALSRWVETDPFAAVSWIRSRQELPSDSLSLVAAHLGQVNLDQAVAQADLIPAEQRAVWIREAMARGAMHDPTTALREMARYQGEPFYDEMLARVARVIAINNGADMAVGAVGNSPSLRVAESLVSAWAGWDPRAAAEWATRIVEPGVRDAATLAVLERWSQLDREAASDWGAALRDRELRERALAAVCGEVPTGSRCD